MCEKNVLAKGISCGSVSKWQARLQVKSYDLSRHVQIQPLFCHAVLRDDVSSVPCRRMDGNNQIVFRVITDLFCYSFTEPDELLLTNARVGCRRSVRNGRRISAAGGPAAAAAAAAAAGVTAVSSNGPVRHVYPSAAAAASAAVEPAVRHAAAAAAASTAAGACSNHVIVPNFGSKLPINTGPSHRNT